MEGHGVKGTFFICGKYVGTPFDHACICNKRCKTAITTDQLRELRTADWEIGTHTYSHTNLVTCGPGKLLQELVTNDRWLHENGFVAARGISYPYGAIDHQALQVAASFYKYGRLSTTSRKTEGGVQLQIPSMPLNAKTSLNDAIRYAEKIGRIGLVVFNGHRIAAKPDEYTWTITDLDNLLRTLKDEGLQFMTMGEACT
jgi:peptidoglycan/xylan/chitin deacetylase (PgdA/CDA1 family)